MSTPRRLQSLHLAAPAAAPAAAPMAKPEAAAEAETPALKAQSSTLNQSEDDESLDEDNLEWQIRALKKVAIFKKFPDETIAFLAGELVRDKKRWRRGDYVCKRNEKSLHRRKRRKHSKSLSNNNKQLTRMW